MSKTRGTSNVPMILGIIGGVLGLPSAVCAGACSAGIGSIDNTTAQAVAEGNTFMIIALIGAILGLVFSLLAKKYPVLSGIMMIIATFLAGITVIIGNMFALVVSILFLIGAVFCFTQRKEVIQ